MIGYWLVPAEPQKSQLIATITELAGQYDAPVFEPHVTLCSSDSGEQSARVLLEEIARQHSPLELAVRGIGHSDKFTKTLFVEFEITLAAQQLSDAIWNASQLKNEHQFDPHLSLIYAYLLPQTKSAEAGGIHLPFARVMFDAIAAINFPQTIRSRRDVEAWRAIARARLSG